MPPGAAPPHHAHRAIRFPAFAGPCDCDYNPPSVENSRRRRWGRRAPFERLGMATSFGALCTDFYINSKLALKMDLPAERDTILHLCDRVAKSVPSMTHFHRYDNEVVLESSRREAEYHWLSMRRTSVRTGHVNPQNMDDAYKYHKMVLEVVPYHLSISPLDVDYLELLFGFDLECKNNHDEVVFEALIANTPMAELIKLDSAKILDVQPIFGMSLDEKGTTQAYFEVKTRTRSRRGGTGRYSDEPLSLFLTLRKYGPISQLKQLESTFDELSQHCETLATEKLVPHLLTPIARHITSGSA